MRINLKGKGSLRVPTTSTKANSEITKHMVKDFKERANTNTRVILKMAKNRATDLSS